MHEAATCIHQKKSVDSLHKYNGPMEEVPMLVDVRHLQEEFPKWHGATLGRSLVAFAPANASSPAQKPKAQSLN